MASKPGILTDWPWTPLGNFKYIVLAPWIIHSTYSFMVKDEKERDLLNFLIFPFLLWRMLHNQIWISLSRYRTAKGRNRIVDKPIEFEQVDRERNWDDQIILSGILFYVVFGKMLPGGTQLPIWRLDGVILMALLHAGPVEFVYYWLHRALHHHYLYSRYHSHHHSSIVTEPITSVTHPFAELITYYVLFSTPLITTVLTGAGSIVLAFGYITYIDLMNNMGHCNFELIPKWLFTIFPPLKYLMYTPSFHSLHHTQFRANYSLFMPLYDYLFSTVDKTSDTLYETSLKKQDDSLDVVYLTHLTTPESIYHMRLGLVSLASKPHHHASSEWYKWLLWPVTLLSMMITWIYGRTFVVERNRLNKLKLQTWAISKYNMQYFSQRQNESINRLIEEAILEAEEKGARVISLGLLNQGEELNRYGGLFVHKNPELKIKVVDGSSLAVAVLTNSIPDGTTQVVIRGILTKVAYATAFALCQKGIQLIRSFGGKSESKNLLVSRSYCQKIWLVGNGLTEEEQSKAERGTMFVPFSQFPPAKKRRKDCTYHLTPAMATPAALENVDSCENWLPRRVMSAWRIGGIVHALEGWNEHECGYTISNVDTVWDAALRHGFVPLTIPTQS
ncbi:Very-long-chain aldehyde decarbonylase CER1 [Citrus sinensis]|uniref:Very-long-chain aldehyde decarbonylase CER1 n=2 Tax=Citrus sinensis TaxID=2711 RepID=A0ACB8JV86_CITSI|nr:Very-long-chain aldehyde decarbonylase CER1 [Citrus sinensis]